MQKSLSSTFHIKYGVVTQTHIHLKDSLARTVTMLLQVQFHANKWQREGVTSSFLKTFTVVVVHTVAWADPLQIGNVVAQLLDALNLLVEEVALNEVSHLEKENR